METISSSKKTLTNRKSCEKVLNGVNNWTDEKTDFRAIFASVAVFERFHIERRSHENSISFFIMMKDES